MARLVSKDRLREVMNLRGVGMGILAGQAGCSRSFVSHLRAGRKTRCSDKLAVRIVEALDVDTDVLFADLEASSECRTSNRSTLGANLLMMLSTVVLLGALLGAGCMSLSLSPDDELLTVDEVAALTRVPTGTLRRWRSLGLNGGTDPGPQSFTAGPKRVVYWRSKVRQWLSQQEEASATARAS